MTWGFKLMRRPRPDREAYQPRMIRGGTPDETVPAKFKQVRLERKRIARMSSPPLVIHLVILAAVIGCVVVILQTCSVPNRIP